MAKNVRMNAAEPRAASLMKILDAVNPPYNASTPVVAAIGTSSNSPAMINLARFG